VIEVLLEPCCLDQVTIGDRNVGIDSAARMNPCCENLPRTSEDFAGNAVAVIHFGKGSVALKIGYHIY